MTATPSRRTFCALGLLGLSPALLANAPAYPARPISLVVPYPPGGNGDNIARVFAKKLGDKLQTPVIVENKPGASGTIGATQVFRAPSDGYTLLLTVTTQLTSSVPGIKPVYDAVTDFQPLAGLTVAPLAFAVPASLGVENMEQLAALSRQRKLAYGSYGTATSTHVVQHLLGQQFKAKDMVHVPYRGEAPMVTDMLGGQIDMGLIGIGQARELEKSGRARILAVLGMQRSEFLPNTPTLTELGYKNMDWAYGTALYGSSRLPAAVATKLQEAGAAIMADPETQQLFRNQSNQPWTDVNLNILRERMVQDTQNWNKILTSVGPLE